MLQTVSGATDEVTNWKKLASFIDLLVNVTLPRWAIVDQNRDEPVAHSGSIRSCY